MTRREMIQFDFAPRWFRPWIRSLSWATRLVVGVAIVVACAAVAAHEVMRTRRPDEPILAVWVQLLLIVVSIVLTELMRPKPIWEDARPSGLGDFDLPTATEGRPVPILFGRVLIKGPNVVWYGDLRQKAITRKIKTGLWSSHWETIGFHYYIGIQFALCRGPGVVLKRVLLEDEEVFSGTVTSGNYFEVDAWERLGTWRNISFDGVDATCDFYGGETTQPVNAYLNDDSRQRIASAITPTAPRYTGTCYIVARESTSAAPTASDRGAFVGQSTMIAPWGFEVERVPALFSGQSGGPAGHNSIGSDGDVNPINVIYELLTNVEWGFGFNPSTIDVGAASSFKLASDNMIAENNGFSMLVDRTTSAQDLLNELQRQIEGVVFMDHRTAKWTVQLVRGLSDANFGYDINTVAQFTDEEVEKVDDFTRGSWEDTTNQIQVRYHKRADDYKESFALAQDMANAIILSGGSHLNPTGNPGIISYPGVKLSALASNLAWRELRGQSFPLARAKFTVNRKFYDLIVGGVFAWTSPQFGFTKLAMRVNRIDYGTLTQNKMVVEAVQDAFSFAPAAMGTPPPTGWTPPSVSLVAYPSGEQLAFEAPRAILVRDPEYGGDVEVSKVWCGARRQGGEVAFEVRQRNAAGAPGGSYVEAGGAVEFVRIGGLKSDLDAGTAIPTASILVDPTPDAQADLEEIFDDDSTLQDLGADLAQLVMVNGEFMLVADAAVSGPDVALQNVYRGALDSAQENHLAGDSVYMIFFGGSLTDTVFDNTYNVDVELRMRSSRVIFAGAVTAISLTMAQRAMRPYPPGSASYNGSAVRFNVPDLEGDGAGLNGVGFDVDWRRRRFDTTDEVVELLADNAPDASTKYRVSVYVDPSGSNDLAFQSAWVTGTGPETPTQAQVVTFGAAGTEIRVQVEVRHNITMLLEGRSKLIHDVVPTSARTSQVYLGGDLQALAISNPYTAAAATAHNVTIGAAYATSDVQHRIDGGAWVTTPAIIPAGSTTGATAVLAIGNTIELRHTVNEAPDPQFVEIDDGTGDVAYGAFSA